MAGFPSIDTDLLRTFAAIADHGGFTRAAEAVNRTQSAVSMQMKRLEEDVLHCTLFQRDGRTVSLTPEGQVLLGYARRILKLHSEVFNTLSLPKMVGTVKIGSPDDYVMRFLPGILSRFAQDLAQREYRIAYTSASLSAINAVVSTGLAVTAQLQSLLPADLRIIGEAENLPQLPSASIVLLRKHNSAASPIIECFAEYIVEGFKL